MKIEYTDKGFQIINFEDRYGKACSLQQSSAIDNTSRGYNKPGSSFDWLGRNDRMHLDRKMVIGR